MHASQCLQAGEWIRITYKYLSQSKSDVQYVRVDFRSPVIASMITCTLQHINVTDQHFGFHQRKCQQELCPAYCSGTCMRIQIEET